MAGESWLYFYPLLLMHATIQSEKNLITNAWIHTTAYPDTRSNRVIRPNLDTIHSHGWLDLSDGPVLLDIPAIDARYFVVQGIDVWSQSFVTLSSRVLKGKARRIAFVRSKAQARSLVKKFGKKVQIIEAPSDLVWLLMRIQSFGPNDFATIQALQERFQLTVHTPQRANTNTNNNANIGPGKNSERGNVLFDTPLPDEMKDLLASKMAPVHALILLSVPSYFQWTKKLLDAYQDKRIDLLKLGPRPGPVHSHLHMGAWDDPKFWDTQTAARTALEAAPQEASQRLRADAVSQGGGMYEGWYYLKDVWYGTRGEKVLLKQPDNLVLRAALAMEALGYLPLAETTYLSAGVTRVGGEALSGANGTIYKIRFKKGQLPPVKAFWSLTVYDDRGFLIDNPIDRFSISSRDELLAEPNGDVMIYMGDAQPETGPGYINWLPIPDGRFSLIFRAYLPTRPIVMEKSGWHMPPVTQ